MKAIEVHNLRKTFRVKEKSPGTWGSLKAVFKPEYKIVKAVDSINFSVEPGEIVAFIGPNGAGKSTTIKMLSGILFPSGGRIRTLGLDPASHREQLSFMIGSVFGQKSQLWLHLPACDTFDLLAKIYEINRTDYLQRLSDLTKAFEIEPFLKTPVRKLSLGERMRCEIVASLLHRPRILFLDEPTIGLDVIAKQTIREIITKFNTEEGITVFLTSHDAGDVEVLAHRTIVINHGTLVYDDSTENFKKDYIKKKTVEISLNKPLRNFDFEEGLVTERDKYKLKIELSIDDNSLNRFLKYAIDQFDINDINIFDPSMEEIISNIYLEQNLKTKSALPNATIIHQ